MTRARSEDALHEAVARSKPSKYRAQKVRACARCWAAWFDTTCSCGCPEATTFDSRGEFIRWHELLLLEKAGEIRQLERQPALGFMENDKLMFTYRADFRYLEGNEGGSYVIEDFKGFRTPLYKLKKKLIEAQHGIEIRETGRLKARVAA